MPKITPQAGLTPAIMSTIIHSILHWYLDLKNCLLPTGKKTNQENNSVIVDLLFTGDVNRCDIFTVQFDSPAAKLGFVNLTKLSKWTPGCTTDDQIIYAQFYHW